uniref:Uncharacterized protein n=1 Tax=Arundo donax TaxID=35708 RepID=A0A0A9HMF6_ARUDO
MWCTETTLLRCDTSNPCKYVFFHGQYILFNTHVDLTGWDIDLLAIVNWHMLYRCCRGCLS